MRLIIFAIFCFFTAWCLTAADRHAVSPSSVLSGEWLYVGGQGARDSAGNLGKDPVEQIHQCLDNVRAVVESAGLHLEDVLYLEVYLADINAYSDLDAVLGEFFPKAPARTVIGVKRMPAETPLEIAAIAFKGPRDSVRMGGIHPAAVKAGGRTYISGILGRRSDTARLPDTGVQQTALAFDSLDVVLRNARMKVSELTMVTVYYSSNVRAEDAAAVATKRLKGVPFMLVETQAIPLRANIELKAVAAPDLDFLPLQDLAAAGDALKRAVSATIYVDTIEHLDELKKSYAALLNDVPPANVTVQTTPFEQGKQTKVAVVALK